MRALTIKVEVRSGVHVQLACDEAKTLSEKLNEPVVFQFNGVRLSTEGKSINEMVADYCRSR